jgi:uncharacterized low-complexity protein
MKKVVIAALAGALSLPVLVFAQQSASSTPNSQTESKTTPKQKHHKVKKHHKKGAEQKPAA